MGGLVLVSFGVEARWWVPRGWPGWQVLVFVPAGGLVGGFLMGRLCGMGWCWFSFRLGAGWWVPRGWAGWL
jgi:hypothetical protein